MGLADNDIPCDRACWNTALRLVLGAEAMSDSNLPLAKLIAEILARLLERQQKDGSK